MTNRSSHIPTLTNSATMKSSTGIRHARLRDHNTCGTMMLQSSNARSRTTRRDPSDGCTSGSVRKGSPLNHEKNASAM